VFAATRHTGRKHRIYQDHEIAYFGVYCPDTDAVYLAPISDVGPHTSGVPARRASQEQPGEGRALGDGLRGHYQVGVMQMLSYASASLVRTPL
jgi:hypothetical protein